ncbi:uncharacterized protein MONOS_7096 [Monocercomonoides exilis]|uniref:uncharacterized protein n=1 Tax=Monocercomonoides exilis TaxID=2049356 RepID=UPI0035595EB8|nr:hypothetical protein MONOS_7096 [Monocercomonoides exilis]|eukprot:MONOS_7096.1-p1 / transcript=MONOS_7096.1 / gene=MONOS_7096 / organism=Monocercomonoides_exilis_PA203 / gene_product=unspecified product / transcript_product=unspecified product / location=Mono_scaffold00235:69684-77624(-) / protein_length=2646 / sequence_SO=supercontig / SO=protein_coding / is_pseudo=false
MQSQLSLYVCLLFFVLTETLNTALPSPFHEQKSSPIAHPLHTFPCSGFIKMADDSNKLSTNIAKKTIEHVLPSFTFSNPLIVSSMSTFFCVINSSITISSTLIELSSSSFAFIESQSSFRSFNCLMSQSPSFLFLLQGGTLDFSNLTLLPQPNIYPRSLIQSSDASNSITLNDSCLSNLFVSYCFPFLSCGKSKRQLINDCFFCNMSVKLFKSSDYQLEHSCLLSVMENTLIYSCVNVFEGGISSGLHSSQEFVCRNTTISKGKREMNALQKKGQMNLTNSQSFSLCEWEDCTAPQGGALYVYNNENAILDVENCSFTKCNASSTNGGGICALNIAECSVKHSTFINCSCEGTNDLGGGGVMMGNVLIQSLVDDCSFEDCSSGEDGGAIEFHPTMTEKQKKCIIDSMFLFCSANDTIDGNGGAIEHWNPTDKVVISNCLFCHCHSMCGGGAVTQHVNANNDGILFYYCFFHNNTCERGGRDIVLYGSTSNNIDQSCYSTTQTENRVSTKYDSIEDRSEWLRNDFESVRFVSSTETQPNAKDTYACGINESHPCGTISRCFTQLIPDVVKDVQILTGTIVETKSVDCGTNSFTIYGQSGLSTTVQTELETAGLSLFAVSTGTLTVSDFVLLHSSAHPNNRASRLFEISGAGEMYVSRLNTSIGSGQSTETAFTTELLNVQNGMLQVDNVNWAKTISTTSLFSLSSTNEISLTLSECAFDGIERTNSEAAVISFSNDKINIKLNSCSFSGCGSTGSENGGSMMLCAGVENEVKVNGGSFDGCFCSASNGLGGGILLQLSTGSPNILISSSFGTNTAKWGNDIFVLSPDLEETAKSQKITCVTASLDSFDRVQGYDNGNTTVAIPLCIYLLPTPEEIYVSNTEASDHSHCGIVKFPCLTIKHSLTRQTETKKVAVSGMIMMADELAFANQKHEIRGNDDESGWTVSDSSATSNSAMVITSVETVLSKLIFSLPSSFSSHSTFISSSSSSLTLSQCSLTLQDSSSELVSLFLSIASGILTIDSFSASSIPLSGNPLISLTGSGSKAELMSNQWLSMTNCTFTEIERTAGSGGCVSIDNSNDENSNGEINIEECVFDGCSVLADGSRGGAMFSQLKGNTKLNIISCTFAGCTAPTGEEKSGFGGGMALKLIDDYSLFVISSPVFGPEKPNVARYGNDLFVESPSLTKSITNASLPFVSEHLTDISLDSMRGFDGSDTTNAIPLVYFWIALGSEIFVGGEGKDMGACGFLDCPCLSIDYSLDRLPEGNERDIKIKGNGILQKCVDVSGAAIKSDNSLISSLECLASLEGTEEAAMKIQGITNFELINFVMPSSFTGDVKSLKHVGSSDASLTVKDCSFTKMEESGEEIISYGLIKADGGTVQLELVTMQSLSFSKDVISVLSSTILNIKNLTMRNVDLDGASGLSISKSSRRGKNEVEQDIVVEWSSFEEVTQNTTADIPVIRNDNDVEPLKMVIRNTTMKKCGGTRCGKGGAIFSLLNEGGKFDCSFCTISECFCSTTGRGGWLFLECTSTAEQPLNFVFSNITFKDNSAFRGRDVYVRCHSLENQIADEQFLLDFRAPFVKDLAMWGCTTDSFVGEEDLLLRVVKYQSETIFVSSVADNHTDSKQCGEFGKPCESLNEGVQHIVPSQYSQLLVSHQTAICAPCSATSVSIRSLESPSSALVHLDTPIQHCPAILATSANVRIECLDFLFSQSFSHTGSAVVCHTDGHLSLSFVQFASSSASSATSTTTSPTASPAAHPVLLNSSLLAIEGGHLTVDNCSVLHLAFALPPFLLSAADHVALANINLQHLQLSASAFEFRQCQSASAHSVAAEHLVFSQGSILCLPATATGDIAFSGSSFHNCTNTCSSTSTSTSTSTSFSSSVLSASSSSAHISLSNFTCSQCGPSSGNDADGQAQQGSVVSVSNAADLSLAMCVFEGAPTGTAASASANGNRNSADSICSWNASLVHLCNTTAAISDLTVANASDGALSVSGGTVRMDDAKFVGNSPSARSSPSASSYPSARRNIACSDGASLTLASLKGGDGAKDNTSLWILDSGCTLAGIPRHRLSPFFIPTLRSAHEAGNEADEQSEVTIRFQGELLLPCNLSFRLATTIGTEELLHRYEFDAKGLVSEKEAFGVIQGSILREAPAEAEVSVCLLFGNADAPSATEPFILKNASEAKNGDEKLVEGGKKEKSIWPIIVIIVCIICIILLVVIVVLAVRWRKARNENKDLREIVNDTVKKDPKLIEMVTMEMSPEEQWRKAEKEAEKKNEERIKKRIYDTNMQHSESSEYLLAESGSTEYILGKDSDKIPEWMLEKDEEEETRKRSPSPSISSTSTTDTSDTDSTFVQREDLCPTTSSMSNLVDAMACSSPHEKLIVDLRDSLFMLLHGKNEKKEMAIGTFQEREQTAAQILFWVANGALHSFEEMDNPLQSLANLSPHIVLFSEHMVICIVMHSDLLSNDDSDSSSVSSSTVATSASDDDDESDSLPSSAFEDEDDFRKECLRWKAPELLINKKMRAAKESVVFSIGMMLWECLTLQIPFGEYEAEVAGQKIANGERPALEAVQRSSFFVLVKSCVSQSPGARPSLVQLKREFIGRFPPGAAVLTLTDAADLEDSVDGHRQGTTSLAFSASSTANEAQPTVNTKNRE